MTVGPFDEQAVAAVQTALEDEVSSHVRLGRPLHAPKILRALLAAWDFDHERAAELLRWEERYGDPEDWAKRAQAAHARAERLAEQLRGAS
jgi:hypothetical protein